MAIRKNIATFIFANIFLKKYMSLHICIYTYFIYLCHVLIQQSKIDCINLVIISKKLNNKVMATSTWALDTHHSEIQFKVRHLVITTVTGSFNVFNGSVETGDDFENAKISFEADVNSINTNNADRDGHLKSPDFFDAAQFPTLTFVSSSFTKEDEDEFVLVGDLTLKGLTKSVKFEVSYGGTAVDPWGNVKAGFELKGKISRQEFGLTWNALTEAGGAVVSDEIKLVANIQLVKQA